MLFCCLGAELFLAVQVGRGDTFFCVLASVFGSRGCSQWGARREGCAELNPKQGNGGTTLLHFSTGGNSQQSEEWEKPSRGILLQSCLGLKPQMSFCSFSWGEGSKSLYSPDDALFQLSVDPCLSPPLLQILPHSPPGESLQFQSLYKQIFL